jgi:hypothetical protein
MSKLIAWVAVLAIGMAVIAMGVKAQISPPVRAWMPMRVTPPAYMFLVLGGTLIAASLAGIFNRWSPLIPTFVIATFIGLLLMPVTNSRQRDTKYVVTVLGLSIAAALVLDLLRSRRTYQNRHLN